MGLLRKLVRVFERVEGYFAFLAVILLIAMMLMVTIDVIGRYVFNQPLRGAQELCENSLVWFTFLSAAWLLKRERHVVVSIVTDRLKPRAQSFLNIIISIIGAIVCFGIVYYGTIVVIETFQRGSVQIYTLGLPLGPLYTIIPIGCAFLVVRFVLRTIKCIGEWKTRKEETGFEEFVKI